MVMCFVPDCKHYSERGQCKFFRFPKDEVAKKSWLKNIRRADRVPSNNSRVCSCHFKDGNKKDNKPTIFKRNEDKIMINTHSELTEESSKNSELTEMRGEASELRSEINEFNKTATTRSVNALADNDDELMNVKLELYEAFTDISNFKKENEMLTEKLSSTEATKNTLQKSVSEKEEELATIKLELEQAYKEVNALRKEKEELLEKLKAEDLVQSILQHPNKLRFYTGLNCMKDFNYILSLISDVEGRFRTLSSEKQLLIVLMKLKLNLRMTDLGYRFQISGSTACRICDIIIPVLEAKIDLLVKCPITAALKKNIPVSYKNTVYENLYQRLVKYSKSKMKQPEEEEEGGTDFEKLDEECI